MERKISIWIIVALVVLGAGMPARVSAMSDDASTLRHRQLALFETDSVEAFEDVTARLKQLLEKEGEDEALYDVWYNETMYVLTYVCSNEAENKEGDQLGDERMLALLRQTQFDNSRHVIERMVDEVKKHRNGAEPNDDLTLMCLKLS